MPPEERARIVTDGVHDGMTWLIILGAVVLAFGNQALKAAGIEPPLTTRQLMVRSLSAGMAALTLGLLLLGTGKIPVHWAFYMGLGGVIGYWGQEALAWAVQVVQSRGGQATGVPVQPPSPPPLSAPPQAPQKGEDTP